MCAIWSPKVCLNENDFLKNVTSEIKRSNRKICKICHQKGGGLGCKNEECPNTYHYKCVLDNEEFILD